MRMTGQNWVLEKESGVRTGIGNDDDHKELNARFVFPRAIANFILSVGSIVPITAKHERQTDRETTQKQTDIHIDVQTDRWIGVYRST